MKRLAGSFCLLMIAVLVVAFLIASTGLADETNTTLGVNALLSNTTGMFNTAIGPRSCCA
jgi:hypothetical protein